MNVNFATFFWYTLFTFFRAWQRQWSLSRNWKQWQHFSEEEAMENQRRKKTKTPWMMIVAFACQNAPQINQYWLTSLKDKNLSRRLLEKSWSTFQITSFHHTKAASSHKTFQCTLNLSRVSLAITKLALNLHKQKFKNCNKTRELQIDSSRFQKLVWGGKI